MKIGKRIANMPIIPRIVFNSDMFKCPNCGHAEYRRVMGDTSHTPCPNCGHGCMYRIK